VPAGLKRDEVARLRSALRQADEALTFYAEPENWSFDAGPLAPAHGTFRDRDRSWWWRVAKEGPQRAAKVRDVVKKVLREGKLKCAGCRHLQARHREGKGACSAQYSAGPSGTFACGCMKFKGPAT
jgi:hypothetical protein